MIELKTLPKGWTIAKLDEICSIQTGKWDAIHADLSGKYRFYTCAFEHSLCNTNRFSGECLILPGNGANVGQVFYYNGEFDAYQRTYVIDKIEIVPKFLYYHLKLNWKKGTDVKQYGSATNYIRIGNFTDYLVQFPSISEQKRILTKLEQQLTDLDKGIEYLETTKQQLKVYGQAVLKWAFEGKLTNKNAKNGELPNGWTWKTIHEVADVTTGVTPLRTNKSYWEKGTIPWITSGALNEEFVSKAEEFVTEKAFEETTLKLLPKHTLLLALYGEGKTRGKCSELLFESTTNQAVAGIKIKKEFVEIRKFLKWFLTKNYQDIRLLSVGGVQPNLNSTIVKKTRFPFPPLNEQTKVLKEIESRLSVCDKIEETIESSLQQAEALRLSIIKKAFEGKLVPQNPSDEPAEKLLERIRALRHSSAKLTKGTKGKQAKAKTEKQEKEKAGKQAKTLKKKTQSV